MPEPRQVFLSHISEERHIAHVLQKYLRQAFGDAFPIFSAFDGESIGGGKKWFDHIVRKLKESAIVFVLVSNTSRQRPWLTFEAGFGDANGAEVIPISIRDFSLGKLAFPLAGFQGRSIDDLPGILADVSNRLGVTSVPQDVSTYLMELNEAARNMSNKSLEVRPFVQKHSLQFELENKGSNDLELLMLEVWIPFQYVSPSWGPDHSKFRHTERRTKSEQDYYWFACTSQRGRLGEKESSLLPVITPSMGKVVANEMKIALVQQQPRYSEMQRRIYYQAHVVDYRSDLETVTYAELEVRQF